MNHFLLKISLCVLISIHGFANFQTKESIVFFHANSSYVDYLAHVQTSNRQITPIEYYNNSNPSLKSQETILLLFEKAQLFFTRKMFSKAEVFYLKLVDLSLTSDWHPLEREIIFQSFLRLAQISPNKAAPSYWLKKAISFSPKLSFPKNIKDGFLRERFLKEHKILKEKAFFMSTSFMQRGLIKVNGQVYNVENQWEIPIYPGTHRVSILTNKSFYFSQVKEQSKLRHWTPILPEVLSGNCQSPQRKESSSLLSSIFLAFYSPTCILNFSTLKPENKKSVLATKHSFLTPKKLEIHSKESFLSKHSHWLWIGLSAVAIGAMTSPQKNYKIHVKRSNF